MNKSGKQTALEELREALKYERAFADAMRVLEYLYMYQTDEYLEYGVKDVQVDGPKILEYFYPGEGSTLFNQERI